MEAFTQLEALTAVMDRINVDTDQIIPKQFLKKIERTGFGKHLFHDWRYLNDEGTCLLYTSPSPRDATLSRMPSSA